MAPGSGEDGLVGARKPTPCSPTRTMTLVTAGRGIGALAANPLRCRGHPYPLLNGVGLADGPLGSRDAVGYAAVAFTQAP